MRSICLMMIAFAPAVAAELNLGFGWVTDADLEALALKKHIQKIDLSFSLITDLGMQNLKAIDGCTDLNLFAVEHITDVGISYIEAWKTIERLNLRGTDITDTSLQQYVSGLTTLRALDVSYTLVTDTGLEALAPLRNLEELSIGGNKISGSGLHVLSLFPKLSSLNLSGSQKRNGEGSKPAFWSASLTDIDLKMVGALSHLRTLNLAGFRISDLGVGELQSLAELRSLDLSETQVSNGAFDTLALLPKLERLRLWRAKRVDDGAAAKLAVMRNLAVLDLSETSVTDRTLTALPPKKLRKLYLSGSKVSSAGVEAFRSANPQCEVSWN